MCQLNIEPEMQPMPYARKQGSCLAHCQAGVKLAVAMVLCVCGCQTTTHVVGQADAPAVRPQTKVRDAEIVAGNQPLSADEAIGTDPCEMRLQNVEAALLLYFSINRQLPANLADLVPLASGDLDLTCPASHQPYLYMKDGLIGAGSPKRIIVSDATPAHDGKRWCILMDPPTPGAALVLETREIPESVFHGYQPD
jgi:hypothetical protein